MLKRKFFILTAFLAILLIITLQCCNLFDVIAPVRDLSYKKIPFESSKDAPTHELWDTLVRQYVDHQGYVNYDGFVQDSAELNDYLSYLAKNVPDDISWNKEELLAYWINSYNANTVALVIRNLPVKSIKDIGSGIGAPWNIRFIPIQDRVLSLEDIEHRILRKMNEPRIHFAINCASKSCPILLNEAYSAEKIEEQLDNQTHAFLSDTTRNKIGKDKVQLSRIFQWFKPDFEKEGSLLAYISQYQEVNSKSKISYLPYDWSLNSL